MPLDAAAPSAAEDRAAVADLVLRYCRALDRLDLPALRALFAPEAHVDMGAIYAGGLDGFVEVAAGFMGAMAATRHELANVLVELDGDAAAAESYVTAWHLLRRPEGAAELLVRARYLHRFARTAQGWRIVGQAEVLDWGEERPVSAAWFDGNAELPKGSRGGADPSYALLRRGA